VRRCPYCDFNSYRAGSSVPEAAYIQALLKDLNYSKVLAGERIAQQRRPTLVKFDVVTSFKQADGFRHRSSPFTDWEGLMNIREQFDKAIATLKDIAESERVKDLASKARVTASNLAKRAKEGALGAAEAFIEANSDPSALKIRYLNADFSIVSPSDGIEIARPQGGTLAISDGAGNGVVINASAEQAPVTETIGTVKKLNDNTYDLGAEDGVNVVVFKI
jgi:hypothetical protein